MNTTEYLETHTLSVWRNIIYGGVDLGTLLSKYRLTAPAGLGQSLLLGGVASLDGDGIAVPIATRRLVAGANVTIVSTSDTLTIGAVVGGPGVAMLTDATPGISLINLPSGELRTLVSGAGLTIVNAPPGQLTLTNTGVLALTSAGAATTLVEAASGSIRSLRGGVGITVLPGALGEVDVATTAVLALTSLGAGETLVATASGGIKSLVAGFATEITPVPANSVTIGADINALRELSLEADTQSTGLTTFLNLMYPGTRTLYYNGVPVLGVQSSLFLLSGLTIPAIELTITTKVTAPFWPASLWLDIGGNYAITGYRQTLVIPPPGMTRSYTRYYTAPLKTVSQPAGNYYDMWTNTPVALGAANVESLAGVSGLGLIAGVGVISTLSQLIEVYAPLGVADPREVNLTNTAVESDFIDSIQVRARF